MIAILCLIIKIIPARKLEAIRLDHAHKFFRRLYFLGSIWFLSQCISDLINNSISEATLKILAQIIVLLALLFWVKNWFSVDTSKITAFVLGYSLSTVPNYFLTPTILIQVEPWKFCFGPGVTILLLLWFSKYRIKILLQIPIIFSLTYLHIYLGSRALALVTFISWMVCLVQLLIGKRKLTVIISLATILTTGFILANIYRDFALSGNFGRNQQIKAVDQFGKGSLILVARSELLYELVAIKENFFLGTGSNPNISNEIANEVNNLYNNFEINQKSTAAFHSMQLSGKIPQHSLLFSFWMTGGAGASLFWLYLLFILSKWTFQTIPKKAEYFYLSKFLYVGFIWNFFFSPLGAGQRVLLAVTVAIIYCDYYLSRKSI